MRLDGGWRKIFFIGLIAKEMLNAKWFINNENASIYYYLNFIAWKVIYGKFDMYVTKRSIKRYLWHRRAATTYILIRHIKWRWHCILNLMLCFDFDLDVDNTYIVLVLCNISKQMLKKVIWLVDGVRTIKNKHCTFNVNHPHNMMISWLSWNYWNNGTDNPINDDTN